MSDPRELEPPTGMHDSASRFAHADRLLQQFFRDPFTRMSIDELRQGHYTGLRAMARLLAQVRWLEHVRGKPFESILEAGCGHGHVTRHLLAIAPHVLAFDFSDPAIAHAIDVTKRPDVFRVANGLDPAAITTERFDLIVMVEFHPMYRDLLAEGATDADHQAYFSELLQRYQERLTDDGMIYVQFSRADVKEWKPRNGRCSPLAGWAFVAPRVLRPIVRLLVILSGPVSRYLMTAAVVRKSDPV